MSEDKKIIIDEDWKSQVAAEREAAQREKQETAGESPSAGGERGAAQRGAIPASFDLLVTTFVTEAMVALGQLPHPATGRLEFDPVHARFAIDMLEVIAEKTKGNLTPEEERGLQQVVHQLRMAFVALSNPAAAGGQPEAGPQGATSPIVTG
jgi:Domain of unknown function (DUF1844)